jgi:DNA-binding response OmpR family regulator
VRKPWSLNVVLVEDDAADSSLILGVLERHPEVASSVAFDRPEPALRRIESGHLQPDLILLDLRLPGMDGFSFLKRVRRHPETALTPVVFLTTSRSVRDVEEARSSSAALYVVKPDSYAELQARLDVVIRRAISNAWGR